MYYYIIHSVPDIPEIVLETRELPLICRNGLMILLVALVQHAEVVLELLCVELAGLVC